MTRYCLSDEPEDLDTSENTPQESHNKHEDGEVNNEDEEPGSGESGHSEVEEEGDKGLFFVCYFLCFFKGIFAIFKL